MKNRSLKISPMRIAIVASLIFAVINIILLGGAYLRSNAARELEQERQSLEENLTQLNQVNQEELFALAGELEDINEEITALETSFPELGAPYALFDQAQNLAQSSQTELLSVSRLDNDLEVPPAGGFLVEEYRIDLDGGLSGCIEFIQALEGTTLNSVEIQYGSFWPRDLLCSFEVRSMGVSGVDPAP